MLLPLRFRAKNICCCRCAFAQKTSAAVAALSHKKHLAAAASLSRKKHLLLKLVAHIKENEEHPLIMMVARFEVSKRQDLLLEALAELSDTPWRLQLIGDGSLRPSLEKLITDKGLTDRVSFLGNQLDVTSSLEESQLLVLLLDWEGLPIPIIEAMRAGLPIIATNVSDINELVSDFLINRNDKDELMKKLK
ncbi:glycosyltransferase [Lysinibacillus sp. NPDC094403]|uniref:glycosyltransferase n=1 Tax=Lysinibacillus sp. NPDC094403 TaxID=3390581 RepID=UPI003D03506F